MARYMTGRVNRRKTSPPPSPPPETVRAAAVAAIRVGHHRSSRTVVVLRVSGALSVGAAVLADVSGADAPARRAPVFCVPEPRFPESCALEFCVPEFRDLGVDVMPTRLRRCGSGGQA
ncbi:hypothetical protein GCM10028793_17610 [Nocardiopsis oceani]